jgi:hypothetical protein
MDYDPENGKPLSHAHRANANAVMHRLRYTPYAIKEAIAERNYDVAMAVLSRCIEREEPWAVMAWLKSVDAIAPDTKIFLFERWGVANEAEARGLIESGRRLESIGEMPILTQLEHALEVIRMCLAKEPQHRGMVAKLLASYAEVEE